MSLTACWKSIPRKVATHSIQLAAVECCVCGLQCCGFIVSAGPSGRDLSLKDEIADMEAIVKVHFDNAHQCLMSYHPLQNGMSTYNHTFDSCLSAQAKYQSYSNLDPLDLGEALWITHWVPGNAVSC
jgi:hypothetical protein